MTERLQLHPHLGDSILQLIEKQSGRRCHIVLIACPMDGPKLGQPTFATSLQPDEMESLVIQIAGGFALAGDRLVEGGPQ